MIISLHNLLNYFFVYQHLNCVSPPPPNHVPIPGLRLFTLFQINFAFLDSHWCVHHKLIVIFNSGPGVPFTRPSSSSSWLPECTPLMVYVQLYFTHICILFTRCSKNWRDWLFGIMSLLIVSCPAGERWVYRTDLKATVIPLART